MNIELNIQPLKIEQRWVDDGAWGLLSHFDDEVIFWGLVNKFRENNIHTTIGYLTGGELGMPEHVGNLTQEQVKSSRLKEMFKNSRILGISFIPFDLGDMQLTPDRYKEIMHVVTDAMRREKPGVVFSFDEFDATYKIKHQDHNAAGKYAIDAATAADVKYFPFSSASAMSHRPDFLQRTTNIFTATDYIKLTQEDREKSLEYFGLFETQTTRESLPATGVIFDHLTHHEELGGHAELYRRIR